MRTIPLTKGKFALLDDEDYDRITALGSFYSFYYKAKNTYFACNHGKYLQRLILNLSTYDQKAPSIVEFLDGNTLNCQKHNLRLITPELRARKTERSKYASGVTPWKGKWKVQVSKEGRTIYLGLYNTYEEAVEAAAKARLEYYGEKFTGLDRVF